MSNPVQKPTFMAGTPRSSGDVQTGEMAQVRAGGRTACVWSGHILTTAALAGGVPGGVCSGGNILIYSGAGRLNTVLPHIQMASGATVFFYDAGAISASGVSVSGQRI